MKPAPSPASGQDVPEKKLEQTHQQVNEVVAIMRTNVEKVLERDYKLSELDARALAVLEGGKQFKQQTQALHRKYWWKNLKMMIILIIVVLVILIIIFVSLSSWLDSGSSGSSSSPHTTLAPKAIADA